MKVNKKIMRAAVQNQSIAQSCRKTAKQQKSDTQPITASIFDAQFSLLLVPAKTTSILFHLPKNNHFSQIRQIYVYRLSHKHKLLLFNPQNSVPMLQEFRQKHEEIVRRIQDKLTAYFPQKQSSERMRQLTQNTPKFAVKTLKDQRTTSANQLFKQNEEQELSNSLSSKYKKQESFQQPNGKLLEQLDELRKRLKKLQKSNSCNNLLNRSDKKQRKMDVSSKVIGTVSKLMTQQSKMALKKKGKMSTLTKTKVK